MTFPEELYYTTDHEWLRLEGEHAFVGITDFAQHELGDIVYVDIDTLEKDVQQHEVFGTVEAVKTVSDLFLPINGKVLEINQLVQTSPELLNSDCYGDGWLVKIEIKDSEQLQSLLNVQNYKNLIGHHE